MAPADVMCECEPLVAEGLTCRGYGNVEFLLQYLSGEGHQDGRDRSTCSSKLISHKDVDNSFHQAHCNGGSHHGTEDAHDTPPQRNPIEVEYTERFLAADLVRRVHSAQATPLFPRDDASIYPTWLSWGRGNTQVRLSKTFVPKPDLLSKPSPMLAAQEQAKVFMTAGDAQSTHAPYQCLLFFLFLVSPYSISLFRFLFLFALFPLYPLFP